MTNEERELPPGWAWAHLVDVLAPIKGAIRRGPFGSTIKKEYFVSAGYKVYEQKNVIQNDFSLGSYYIDQSRFEALRELEIKPGELLITGAGTIGKIAVVPTNIERGIINQALIKIRLNEKTIDTQYFVYRFSSEVHELIRTNTKGSAMKNISSVGELAKMRIPLPPISEQKRIVGKIELLFTQLEAGITALKHTRAKLKRYKASVLKTACEGRLVPQDPNDEPAEKLLERILAERRAKWEADLIAKSKDPKKVKYEEPQAPDTSELPELPKGWCWATMEQLTETIGGVTKGRNFDGKKTIRLPYLRVANVQRGILDLSEIKEIDLLEAEIEKYRLLSGDLVLTEGGDWDKLGRSAIWRNQISLCVHQNHIFRARPYLREVMTDWLMYYTNSEQGQKYFSDSSKQTTNLASINLTQLRACPIPLPPYTEQRHIVAEVERRLSVVQELEQTVNANLARAERLRQAILKRAFEGKLVPQDSNDEPAEKLLERVKAARGE